MWLLLEAGMNNSIPCRATSKGPVCHRAERGQTVLLTPLTRLPLINQRSKTDTSLTRRASLRPFHERRAARVALVPMSEERHTTRTKGHCLLVKMWFTASAVTARRLLEDERTS